MELKGEVEGHTEVRINDQKLINRIREENGIKIARERKFDTDGEWLRIRAWREIH